VRASAREKWGERGKSVEGSDELVAPNPAGSRGYCSGGSAELGKVIEDGADGKPSEPRTGEAVGDGVGEGDG
jgi:hypothetical protein